MPIGKTSPFLPLIAPLWFHIRVATRVAGQRIVGRLEDGLTDLWKAFPHPFKMLDVVIGFATGLPGVILTIPIETLKAEYLAVLRVGKVHNRLMTVEDAASALFDSHSEFIKTVTFTNDSTFLQWLGESVGRWAWSFVKRFKTLLKILGAKSEEELIQIIVKKVLTRLRFLRFLAVLYAFILVVEIYGFFFMLVGFTLTMSSGRFERGILPQDSKRIRTNKRRRVRENKRKGSDEN